MLVYVALQLGWNAWIVAKSSATLRVHFMLENQKVRIVFNAYKYATYLPSSLRFEYNFAKILERYKGNDFSNLS